MPKTRQEHMKKDCFWFDKCWNNVRTKCPVSDECREIKLKVDKMIAEKYPTIDSKCLRIDQK